MKKRNKNLALLPTLIAGLGPKLAGQVTAQSFTNLHSFTGSDGAHPEAVLVLLGDTLYGTTEYGGGSSDNGTVFEVSTDGTAFADLYIFTAAHGPLYTNRDGAFPQAGLISSGNILYGTAYGGGSSGDGTVFRINTDGTGFTNLHSFAGGSDGGNPAAGLILSGSTLYGTAQAGGSSGYGMVFRVNTDGTGYTNLHSFSGGDGDNPAAGLILASNTLYGTTTYGGSSSNGVVFKINTDGSGFTNLHSFTAIADSFPATNSDGANPAGGLILSGNILYGTTVSGGSSDNGTVFRINTDGSGFKNLHDFNGGSDGAEPQADLTLSGDTLYGTTARISPSLGGTVFAINTNGTGFTNLHSFTAILGPLYTNGDGASPQAGLTLSGSTLYGTAANGGYFSNGTVFSISLGSVSPPQLAIIPSGTNIVLTWPTNAAVFTLQCTTNLASPAAWGTVFPGPVVVNGQNTVTNPISGTLKSYRLSQ